MTDIRWHCLQLGSREHYAIPRALHRNGLLNLLITDSWLRPKFKPFLRALRLNKLAGRYHPDLEQAAVRAFTLGRIVFDLQTRWRGYEGWPAIMQRNGWFERQAVRSLVAETGRRAARPGATNVLFSYSYAALEPFKFAKRSGWRTVLGQIDPGPIEAEYVHQHTEAYRSWQPVASRPAASYWQRWQEEVALADVIVANSRWSMDGLIKGGVPAEKIRIVPLPFESLAMGRRPVLTPAVFSTQRKLKVLFLGQIILRKGIGQLLEAIRMLETAPVEFILAGPMGLQLPAWAHSLRNLSIRSEVEREKTADLYREADVFILPTLSDGFALTQLEALAEGVPCVVSRHCGEVVIDGQNGIVLKHVTAQAIVEAIKGLLDHPENLSNLRRQAVIPPGHSLIDLATALSELGLEL